VTDGTYPKERTRQQSVQRINQIHTVRSSLLQAPRPQGPAKANCAITTAGYNALEEEFALASALIKARSEAEMTQEQVAEAMGTTQAVIARLESGKALPSTRTLERFAKATRTRLRISFEPDHEVAR
jgi:ribosome-binding protein aMBF1 (putative translation factor)